MDESSTELRIKYSTILEKIPFIYKFYFIAFFCCHFISSFIFVTTNSLYDSEVSILLRPIEVTSFFLQIALGSILLYYFFKIKQLTKFFIVSAMILIFGSLMMELYEFFPCMFKHGNSVDYLYPHSVSKTLKQSFFCPSYSNGSRLYLLFYFGLGIVILFSSMFYRHIYLNEKR